VIHSFSILNFLNIFPLGDFSDDFTPVHKAAAKVELRMMLSEPEYRIVRMEFIWNCELLYPDAE
jgi:hypothetical protein